MFLRYSLSILLAFLIDKSLIYSIWIYLNVIFRMIPVLFAVVIYSFPWIPWLPIPKYPGLLAGPRIELVNKHRKWTILAQTPSHKYLRSGWANSFVILFESRLCWFHLIGFFKATWQKLLIGTHQLGLRVILNWHICMTLNTVV